jgi:hypothetical protein
MNAFRKFDGFKGYFSKDLALKHFPDAQKKLEQQEFWNSGRKKLPITNDPPF